MLSLIKRNIQSACGLTTAIDELENVPHLVIMGLPISCGYEKFRKDDAPILGVVKNSAKMSA